MAHHPSKTPTHIKSVASQADRRKVVTFYDQHRSSKFPTGRPWWGHVEMPSDPMFPGGVVGSLTPGDHTDTPGIWESAWEAPWLPDEKYLRSDTETGKVTIHYGAMLSDYRAANEKYYAAAAVIAFEKGWEAPEPNGTVEYRFRAVLGPPPQSPKIPQAAMAGDPWLLGFSREPNEELVRILKATAYGGTGVVLMPPVKPDDVLTMSKDDLNALIARAVAEAMASTKVDPMAKARAAKAAKKQESSTAEPLVA